MVFFVMTQPDGERGERTARAAGRRYRRVFFALRLCLNGAAREKRKSAEGVSATR
jgi:hypothetical protein